MGKTSEKDAKSPSKALQLKTKFRRKKKKQPPAPIDHKSEALSYLQSWHDDRDNWKFKKNIQSFLVSSMYDSKEVSKECFRLLLPYLAGSQGAIRQRIVDEAQTVVEQSGSLQQHTEPAKQVRIEEGADADAAEDNSETAEETAQREADEKRKRERRERRRYQRAQKLIEVLSAEEVEASE